MRKLLVAALALGALLVGTPVASAHSVVTGSNPADGSEVTEGPAQASISFNEVPQSQFATLNVVGPDNNLWSKGDARIEGQSVVVDVGELGPAGEYTLAYRVVSADGHPINGTLRFTLTQAGSGTPGPAADASSAAGGSESDDSSGGLTALPFVVVGVVVFAGALVYALRKPKGA